VLKQGCESMRNCVYYVLSWQNFVLLTM